ncbi:MAG TPA: glycosyltransferase [Verrucomicrobiae bacterium]|nr:glycosyltransferase [Verrucomicrobiae bacterium]
MTVGYYAPLPPARTGVADYAAALLAELRRHGQVEVSPSRCDIALYQLGNNPLHSDIYRRALDRPGVVTLHDAVLHHFLLGQLSETEYIEEFVYNYGEWNRSLAHELWNARPGSGADTRYFEYPMLKRAVERALAIVVHNPAAARMVRAAAPQARVAEIPHLLFESPAVRERETARYRKRLGIDESAFVFGVFGYLRESKRLHPILDVFREVYAALPATALLVAGDFVSATLDRCVAPLLHQPGVVRRPFLEDTEFRLAANMVDACMNLRDPAAGETSGIVVRMMGLGKPVLVTDGEECSRFPEDACVRIPPGPAERESLLAHMILLPSMKEVARSIGSRGAAYIAEHHRVDRIGQQYWDLLCDSYR